MMTLALASASEMTVERHLGELRNRLIKVTCVLIASFALSLLFASPLLEIIKRPLGDVTLQALSIEEPIFVVMKIAFALSVALTTPFALVQAFRFLAPALSETERRLAFALAVVSPLLFVLGALFAYFGLLPSMLKMFLHFGANYVQLRPQLNSYVSLFASVTAIMGLTFQVPVVMLVLGYFRIVNSRMCIRLWRHVIVGSSVVAAVITPDPTAISMLMVMSVLLLLYFVSAIAMFLAFDAPHKLGRAS